MNIWRFIRRSLWHYRRQHLGIGAGAALGAMVLVGALGIGDSVQHTLRQRARARLGGVSHAVVSEDRLVRADLAERLSKEADFISAPLLQLRGTGVAGGGDRRVGDLQISGIDGSFFQMAPRRQNLPAPAPEEAYINQALAEQLRLAAGDELLLRLRQPHALPIDAPLSPTAEFTTAVRVTVKRILSEDAFGNFSLRNDQRAPLNCFVALPWLNAVSELDGRANVVLIRSTPEQSLSQNTVETALNAAWTPADAQLVLRRLPDSKQVELRTDRVFLSRNVTNAAEELWPESGLLLSYFVNHLKTANADTPYSFVTGVDNDLTRDLAADEVVISQWLADDLRVAVGDLLECEYFIPGSSNQLRKRSIELTVRRIVSQSDWPADSSWMPAFPGLADSENCRDWDPGIPIDLSAIRDKDEVYWDTYGGTPKALLSLSAARALWANRFGNATAVRLPASVSATTANTQLRRKLTPASLGIRVAAVADAAQQAAEHSVDLGQIFIGLSFFLICAAILLTALLFRFNIEQRGSETGLLLAVGLERSQVSRALLLESTATTVIGSVIGGVAGILYCRGVVRFLNTIWRGAVASAQIEAAVRGQSVAIGIFVIVVVCFAAMLLALRHQVQQTIRRLQQDPAGLLPTQGRRRSWLILAAGAVLMLAAVILIPILDAGRGRDAAGAFFGIGSLFLIGGLCMFYGGLNVIGVRPGRRRPGVLRLAIRNCARRPLRSAASTAILACGTFLVVAVSANRQSPAANADQRNSGTGGFPLYIETALPLAKDLNDPETRTELLLDDPAVEPLTFLPFRVRSGDDASCLNLNRAQQPRLLGAPVAKLQKRRAFRFQAVMPDVDADAGWDLLRHEFADGSVPGIADYTVIVWGLGKKPGETISYQDENGTEFQVRLIAGLGNSIFQGNILIAEDHFVQRFPSVGGYRIFLADGPHTRDDEAAAAIRYGLADYGVRCTASAERLANFSQVENTYLTVFLALGGLGLVLGTLGLGILVLRNALEREGELAVQQALGLGRPQIFLQLALEHVMLIAKGLAIGLFAGIAAVLPALLTAGRRVPYRGILAFAAATLIIGILAVVIAGLLALRRDFRETLREL